MLSRLVRVVALAIAAAVVLTVTARTSADVDLWGHLRFGLDILQTRGLEAADPYSFTSDRPWINHEWLSEVAIAVAWKIAGAPGLIVLKLACIVAALALMASTLREQAVTRRPAMMLLGLTLAGILPRATQVRPQLFSVLLFAALIWSIVRAGRGSSRRLLWTIPILALWANLHGGWLVGVATVGLFCAGEAWARGRVTKAPSHVLAPLLIAGLATASTLLNPYGVGLWAFLLETVRFGREGIGEWGPAWRERPAMIVWTCFAVLTAMAMRARVRPSNDQAPDDRHRGNPAWLAIPILWGLAALRVSRLDAFFAMSVIGLMPGPLVSLLNRRAAASQALSVSWKLGAAAAALVLVLCTPTSRKAFTCIGIHPTWPEPRVVDLMRERRLGGRVVTFFDWGEYAIWNMPLGMKVSMDGRRETVYSERTVASHLQLYLGTERGLSYLRELNADYIWLPNGLPVEDLLTQRGWRTIFEGPRSVLLSDTRPTSGSLELTAADTNGISAIGANSTQRCFPGP